MPRMIDLIRASEVPANLMQAAARGALSVPANEIIEILVHLAIHNKVFSDQARLTLAGWDEYACEHAASDPQTPKEVLDYWIAAENLRPALLPVLLENPAIENESLIALAASSSREVVEAMLRSERVKTSPEVLNTLKTNANVQPNETAAIEALLASHGVVVTAPETDEVLETPAQEAEPEEVLDEDLTAYLNANAKEISAEAGKPFQPLGGVFEDLPLGEPEAPTEAAASAASSTGAAHASAAPQKAPIPKKPHTGAEQERGSALQKINKLDIKGRIQLAMKGTKEERSLLIRDGTKVVALAVLESPKISDAEVEKFAGQKNVLEAVLRQIPLKRRFMKHYGIVRSLVFNPRTPLDISLGLMKNLLVHDLRNLSGNKEVSETVRKLATKMFKQKSDTTKKSTD